MSTRHMATVVLSPEFAKHANMGALDVSDGAIEQIIEACAAMIAVRNYLLYIKPKKAD